MGRHSASLTVAVYGRLDCGLGDPGYLDFRVTGISTHPHHYPKGQKLGLHVSNRNSWLIGRLWCEDTRSESVDGVWPGDV